MFRIRQHLWSLSKFDQLPVFHYRNAVRHLGDHPHVVGHQHDPDAALPRKAADQREDLCLH